MKLLVVDDDPAVLKAIKTQLQTFGYEVLGLTDSREAAERVEREKFNGIFVDSVMPYLDGCALIRVIRESGSNSSVPIVMLTGYDDVNSMRAAFQAGVSFFVTKPLDQRRLGALLNIMQGSMLREKRSYVRLPLRTVVNCRIGEHEFKSFSVNIAEGGMLLDTSGGVEVGDEVELIFGLPHVAPLLNPRAKVTRRSPSDQMGVTFTKIAPEEIKAIRDFIAGIVIE